MANQRQQVWGGGSGSTRKGEPAQGQLSFAQRRSWGGPRIRSGRKAAKRANVAHAKRPPHVWSFPVHVTLRRAKGLPSLRSERIHQELRAAIRRVSRGNFRIVHYSVQRDHVHMIVEAEHARALANGMKSFTIRAARNVNARVLGRRGSLWGDRYHRRDLTSPREVRNCLVYVNNNHLKHHEFDAGLVDPCSSAAWFSGWMQRFDPPPQPPPTAEPETWLLERGWKGTDGFPRYIHLGELPAALRA